MASTREMLLDRLVDLLSVIREPTYRTTVRDVIKTDLGPHQIQNFPTIVLWLGPEEWVMDDHGKSVISSNVRCTIVGYYGEDLQGAGGYDVTAGEEAGEALMQDMKQVIGSFLLTDVNSSINRWQVTKTPAVRWEGPVYNKDTRRGWVVCTMNIRLLFQAAGTF